MWLRTTVLRTLIWRLVTYKSPLSNPLFLSLFPLSFSYIILSFHRFSSLFLCFALWFQNFSYASYSLISLFRSIVSSSGLSIVLHVQYPPINCWANVTTHYRPTDLNLKVGYQKSSLANPLILSLYPLSISSIILSFYLFSSLFLCFSLLCSVVPKISCASYSLFSLFSIRTNFKSSLGVIWDCGFVEGMLFWGVAEVRSSC